MTTNNRLKGQGMNWIRKDKRLAIYLRDECECAYCGSQESLTLDHLVPVCKGGSNSQTNLVTACIECNLKRGKKRWRAYAEGFEGAVSRINKLRRRSIYTHRKTARAALEESSNNVTSALNKSA